MEWPATKEELEAIWTVVRLGTDIAKDHVDHGMKSRFRAVATNRSAATSAQAFLTEQATDDQTTHTRVFVVDGEIAGFYALSVGEALLNNKTRRKLGARTGTSRIPTAHIDWMARHTDAPRGTGRSMVSHAIAVVEQDLQPVTPIMGLSLDAFDDRTAKAWEPFGFTLAHVGDKKSSPRMFLPLRGYGLVGLRPTSN